MRGVLFLFKSPRRETERRDEIADSPDTALPNGRRSFDAYKLYTALRAPAAADASPARRVWHLAVARGKVFTIDNDSGEGTTNQFSRHCTHETADEGRFWRRLARESFHETADVRREAEGFAFCLLGRERQTPRRESRDAELDLDAGASAWSWRAGGEREGRRERRKVFTSFDCRPEGKFSYMYEL